MKVSTWQKVSSKIEFANQRIKVRNDSFLLPNNKQIEFCVLERGAVVAVLPVTSAGEIVAVKQFRPAVDEITVDIPGGGIKVWENEMPLEAAKRELKEETGYTATNMYQLGGMIYPDSGRSEQQRYIFVAEDLISGEAEPEETEFLQIKKIPILEALDGILAGEYKDITFCLAVLLYASKQGIFNKQS